MSKNKNRKHSKRFYRDYNKKMAAFSQNRTETATSLGFDKIENITGVKLA